MQLNIVEVGIVFQVQKKNRNKIIHICSAHIISTCYPCMHLLCAATLPQLCQNNKSAQQQQCTYRESCVLFKNSPLNHIISLSLSFYNIYTSCLVEFIPRYSRVYNQTRLCWQWYIPSYVLVVVCMLQHNKLQYSSSMIPQVVPFRPDRQVDVVYYRTTYVCINRSVDTHTNAHALVAHLPITLMQI